MIRLTKRLLRRTIEASGYWACHKTVLPFGVDYLWDIQRIAARHNSPIRLAFDIGAHYGDTATEFLDAFPLADVYSFEPHPDSFFFLQKKKTARLHSYLLAMSNQLGPSEFFVHSELATGIPTGPASANNSLVSQRQFGLVAGQYKKTITVDRQTVDRFCSDNRIASLDLLKIDTEGHEVEVLEGSTETLAKRGVKFVFLEFETILPVREATGGALAPAAALLEPLGFRYLASYQINLLDEPLYAAFNALYFRKT